MGTKFGELFKACSAGDSATHSVAEQSPFRQPLVLDKEGRLWLDEGVANYRGRFAPRLAGTERKRGREETTGIERTSPSPPSSGIPERPLPETSAKAGTSRTAST
jgi:hypothetical protein